MRALFLILTLSTVQVFADVGHADIVGAGLQGSWIPRPSAPEFVAAPDEQKSVSYDDASRAWHADRKAGKMPKPMLVIVGAAWCPGCETYKKETVHPMLKSGALSEVQVVFVDKDTYPELAATLMGPKREEWEMPHTSLFYMKGDVSTKAEIKGRTDSAKLRSLLDRLTAK